MSLARPNASNLETDPDLNDQHLEKQLDRLIAAWTEFQIDVDYVFRKLSLMLLVSETELYIKDREYYQLLNECAGELHLGDESQDDDFASIISKGYDNFSQN